MDQSPQEPSYSPHVSALGKSDKPSKRDLLDREVYVAAIAALIVNRRTQAPLTIGIYGPWGSGKSSFLAQLAERLPKRFPVAKFNPWRLTAGGEVWAGLVKELAPIIDRRLSLIDRIRFLWMADPTRGVSKLHTRLAAASKNIGNWLTVATATGGFLVVHHLMPSDLNQYINDKASANTAWASAAKSFIGNIGIDITQISLIDMVSYFFIALLIAVLIFKVGNAIVFPLSTQIEANIAQFKNNKEDLKSMSFKDFETVRKIIGDFSEKQNKNNHPYLVLMIDDLDRCVPERIVSVLESINSFISELPIVCIVAMDTEYVTNAVTAYYRNSLGPIQVDGYWEDYGNRFLEKIVHIPFQLVNVRSYERYIESLLTISTDDKQDTVAEKLADAPSNFDVIDDIDGVLNKILAYYFLFASTITSKIAGDERFTYFMGISVRILFGLQLTEKQQQWLACQPFEDQISAKILQTAFVGNYPLINLLRSRGYLEKTRAEILSAAIKIEESDRAILRNHIHDLRGNPRGIKRFVNSYLVAKGLSGLFGLSLVDGFRLSDLAAWLVLIQNWPQEASVLCQQAQLLEMRPIFTEDWVKRTPAVPPPEMVRFVYSNVEGLNRLALSTRGLDIARCFSYFTTRNI